MFKKRSARAGGARKTTPKVQASNTTSAPALLSFGADEDEGPTFEVKKRKLKQKKKRKEDPAPAPRTTLVLGLQRGGPRGAPRRADGPARGAPRGVVKARGGGGRPA